MARHLLPNQYYYYCISPGAIRRETLVFVNPEGATCLQTNAIVCPMAQHAIKTLNLYAVERRLPSNHRICKYWGAIAQTLVLVKHEPSSTTGPR